MTNKKPKKIKILREYKKSNFWQTFFILIIFSIGGYFIFLFFRYFISLFFILGLLVMFKGNLPFKIHSLWIDDYCNSLLIYSLLLNLYFIIILSEKFKDIKKIKKEEIAEIKEIIGSKK